MTEYGFGADIEFLSFDLKAEDPMRLLLPGAVFIPGGPNVTQSTGDFFSDVGSGAEDVWNTVTPW